MSLDPFTAIWDDLAKKLHNGDRPLINEDLIRLTADQLTDAITSAGVPDDFVAPLDETTLARLRDNVQVFSGFKTYHQLKDATGLLFDQDGSLKSFSDFRRDVLALNEKYNQNWLRTEYNHTVASAQMTAQWKHIQANKEGLPALTYLTANDERVRATHQAINGVTRPVDDWFWDSYYPPNGWGCRCTVSQGPGGSYTDMNTISFPDVPDMFLNNTAKEGVIFPSSHPFFKVTSEARTSLISELDKIFGSKQTVKKVTRKKPTPAPAAPVTETGLHPMAPEAMKGYPFKLDDRFWDQFDKPVNMKISTGNKGAYYAPWDDTFHIFMNRRWNASEYYQKRVIYHEAGHALHYQKKWITSTYSESRVSEAFAKSQKAIQVGGRRKKGVDMLRYEEIDRIIHRYHYNYDSHHLKFGVSEADFQEMVVATADTLAALTKGRYGFGHRKSYWRAEYPKKEWFVHGLENRFAGNPVFQEVMPEVYDILEELLDELFKP